MMRRYSLKLSMIYFGPFAILEKKMDLWHIVWHCLRMTKYFSFHVSLLKLYKGNSDGIVQPLPLEFERHHPKYTPGCL